MIAADTAYAVVFWVLVAGCIGTAAFLYWARKQPHHDPSCGSADADCVLPSVQPPHADWS